MCHPQEQAGQELLAPPQDVTVVGDRVLKEIIELK